MNVVGSGAVVNYATLPSNVVSKNLKLDGVFLSTSQTAQIQCVLSAVRVSLESVIMSAFR